jgi:hypothetical protein
VAVRGATAFGLPAFERDVDTLGMQLALSLDVAQTFCDERVLFHAYTVLTTV